MGPLLCLSAHSGNVEKSLLPQGIRLNRNPCGSVQAIANRKGAATGIGCVSAPLHGLCGGLQARRGQPSSPRDVCGSMTGP
jgi:hypothetical protein